MHTNEKLWQWEWDMGHNMKDELHGAVFMRTAVLSAFIQNYITKIYKIKICGVYIYGWSMTLWPLCITPATMPAMSALIIKVGTWNHYHLNVKVVSHSFGATPDFLECLDKAVPARDVSIKLTFKSTERLSVIDMSDNETKCNISTVSDFRFLPQL